MVQRPRRLRRTPTIRALAQETRLQPSQFVYPLFLEENPNAENPIASMPGQSRLGLDRALGLIEESFKVGVRSFALFPVIADSKKDPKGSESKNPQGLFPQAIREIKKRFPESCLFTDVALDPYSSDGHDGLVVDGEILNDETLPYLGQMALMQAESGADFVAPSDMMDGRVGYLREVLDRNGFSNTGIMAYTAKYASCFYGPFRDALSSAPKFGDKKTYQMNPSNSREALRELDLDLTEGADIVMVKPALAYLDVIRALAERSPVPVSAYNVSGEYAMIKAAAKAGSMDESRAILEVLTSIRRAGAEIIFTYHALEAARLLLGRE